MEMHELMDYYERLIRRDIPPPIAELAVRHLRSGVRGLYPQPPLLSDDPESGMSRDGQNYRPISRGFDHYLTREGAGFWSRVDNAARGVNPFPVMPVNAPAADTNSDSDGSTQTEKHDMKTTYFLNGLAINRNDSIPYNGADATVTGFYDEYIQLSVDCAPIGWFPVSELGITIRRVVPHWYFNYLTGYELRVGDLLPAASGDTVRCVVAGVSPSFSPSRESPFVRRIDNTTGADEMPIPSDSRIVDGVAELDINGVWVPTSRVGFCERTPYDKESHFVFRGNLYPLTEAEDFDGVMWPSSRLVTVVDGSRQPAGLCEKINGRYYLRMDLHPLVDRNGQITGYRVHIPNPDSYTRTPAGYCPTDDVGYCYGTGEPYPRGMLTVFDDDHYCSDWLDENTFICGDCGNRFYNDECYGDGYCEDCYNNRDDDDCGVCGYGNKSADHMRSEKDVPIKFGIELEVEPIHSRSRSIAAFKFPRNYVVLKEDGSLHDSGFEIVTRPDCPSVHKRIFGDVLADDNVRSTTTSWKSGRCGIHIHVSRAPLSQLWIGRMLVLVNSPKMKPIVSKVAGRYAANYSRITNKKLTDGKKRGYERYDALNTSGENTIEFRLFRGTLAREPFLKNIEFVEAVLAYTRPSQSGNSGVDDPEKFGDFVRKNRSDYKHLYKFMTSKGLVSAK